MGTLRIICAIHHVISSPCGTSAVGYPTRGLVRYDRRVETPALTWIVYCVDHDSSIWSIPSMLMYQRSDLRRFRFPSHTTVILVVFVVPDLPIIACFTVRLAWTGDVLDPTHVLSVGRRYTRNTFFHFACNLFIYTRVLSPI